MSVQYSVAIVQGWLSKSDWDYGTLIEAGIEEDNIFSTSPMGNGNVVVGNYVTYASDEEVCIELSGMISKTTMLDKPTVCGPWEYGVWLIGRYL